MRISGVIFLTVSSVAFGQLNGPSLGVVPDTGAIRSMYGSAAAGAVGDRVELGAALSLVEVAPSQDFVLASAAESGKMLLVPVAKSVVPMQLLGIASAPDKIVFSPNGSAAALWFANVAQIQIISGLPASASIRNLDVSYLSGMPLSIAISDDGQWAAGVWSNGVYAFGPEGQPRLLPTEGAPMAVAFFHGKQDATIITSSQVLTISDLGGQASSTLLWNNPSPANDAPAQVAVGFAVSADNQRITVTGDWGGVYTINLANNNEGSYVMCGCTPTGLASLGGSLYRLTGMVDGAVKVYDAAANQVWMVPLANTNTGANGGGQ